MAPGGGGAPAPPWSAPLAWLGLGAPGAFAPPARGGGARPRGDAGDSHAFSVVLKSRFIHRLIEVDAQGTYTVDRQQGDWGSCLEEVVNTIEQTIASKHGLTMQAVVREDAGNQFC